MNYKMKLHNRSKPTILLLILWLTAVNVSAQTFSGGAGTYSSPYLISSKADMVALANAVNSGTNSYPGNFFRLTQNLTGSNALTTSVGDYSQNQAFAGIFDGNGHEIELNNVQGGVFCYISYATIYNLGVTGTVSASTPSSTFYKFLYSGGGICAVSESSTIAYCYNTSTVSAVYTNFESNTDTYAGGICGYANGTTITDCFNMGDISSSSNFFCTSGGICGSKESDNNILNCYNIGNVSAVCQTTNSYPNAGGISGSPKSFLTIQQSLIKNCISANARTDAKSYDGETFRASGAARISYSNNKTSKLSNNYALFTMFVNGSTLNSSDATSIDGADISLENFKSQSWIQNNLGWDFNTVWQMSASSSVNQGFPVFKNTAKPPMQYTIIAQATSNGNISSRGESSVTLGENKTYTITPNAGFQIAQVWIDGSYNNNAVSSGTYTFTEVSRNHVIEAFFGPVSPPIFSGGRGYQDNPYLISSKADMVALADAVEGGTSYNGMYFRLTQSLTGANAVSTSVGNYYNSFAGIFDGQGYEIELNNAPMGVFGNISNATIQNLGVCGTVFASASLFGRNLYAGGICGNSSNSTIACCYNAATISAVSTANTETEAGGICGTASWTTITNCFNIGAISGSSSNDLYNYGGICGELYSGSNILNCYNSGNISAITQIPSSVAGGICGRAGGNETDSPLIKNCFSTNSSIDAKYSGDQDSYLIGRIIGWITAGNVEQSNNYASSKMTINGSTVNSSDATDNNGADASLSNFQSQSWIQSTLGWDFNTIWQMSSSSSVNQGLPIFKALTNPVYYTITASSGSDGNISPPGSILVSQGDNQTFTFTPNPGYQIDQVFVDGTNNTTAVSAGSYTFTNVTANHTISVSFKQEAVPTYMITASAGSGGIISPSGIRSVNQGDNQTFTFTPNTGFDIDQVLVDGTNNPAAVSEGSYTFTNVTTDHTISVSFKQKQYTITASADSNGIIAPNGNVTVNYGDSQPFTFTPKTGYDINQVLVDGTNNTTAVSTGSYTFTNVTADHTISVSFKQQAVPTYTITASAGNNGTISPSGTISVSKGSDQPFTITPDPGYGIDLVLVDGTNNTTAVSAGSYTFTNVTADHTISVSFKQQAVPTYTITASAGTNGTISPTGAVSVSQGHDQPFTITPNPNYLIDEVLVDGVSNASAKASGSYTFTNVTADHTISVSFKPECLPDMVVQVWDDVLSVINNPSYNGGYTFVSYQWLRNGADIPGETSGNLYLANSSDRTMSDYTCRVTTSTGQVLQSCPFQATKSSISVYPNPTEGTVIVESPEMNEGDRISVYNSAGTLVKHFSAKSRQTQIDLGNQPKGIYVIKVNGKQVKIILL